MQIEPETLNKLEELDILILNHDGNPVAFTKSFSMYIDSFYINLDTDPIGYSKETFKSIFKNFVGDKIKSKHDIEFYCKIIVQIFEYIREESDSCEDFRVETLKRLRL